MKKHLFLPISLFLFASAFAQSTAKKYVLIEHFTNSNCSTCASRNPAFFDLIALPQYADQVHHVSVHPPVPYPACVFYQANKVDNEAWSALHGIQGTPRVALNGKLMPPSNPLLRTDSLNRYVGQTSPISIKVVESGSISSRNVKIDLNAHSDMPAGDYRFFAAIVEKLIDLQTPNQEKKHHNVFRDMLTPVDGTPFTTLTSGQTKQFTYDYNIVMPWNAAEIYVLAFVKNVTTGEIINSGTVFDVQTSATPILPTTSLHLSPNPALDFTMANLGDDTALQTLVYSAAGQLVYSNSERRQGRVEIPLKNLTPGIYYTKIMGQNANYTAKFLKN